MEKTTMTLDAMSTNRVRSVRPGAGRLLLADTRGWVQGSGVSIAVSDARLLGGAPASVARPTFDAPTYQTFDVASLRHGDPPV